MADRQKILALASLVDRLERVGTSARLPKHEWDRSWEELVEARTRLLRYLGYANMLVGAEYCDECGEVVGVVTKIEREPGLAIMTTAGDVYLEEIYGNYFRLPGSDAYGDQAIVELARRRAAAAAVV
jgi:hypothetical protein